MKINAINNKKGTKWNWRGQVDLKPTPRYVIDLVIAQGSSTENCSPGSYELWKSKWLTTCVMKWLMKFDMRETKRYFDEWELWECAASHKHHHSLLGNITAPHIIPCYPGILHYRVVQNTRITWEIACCGIVAIQDDEVGRFRQLSFCEAPYGDVGCLYPLLDTYPCIQNVRVWHIAFSVDTL